LTEPDFDLVRATRANEPQHIAALQANRKRRPLLGDDGKLFILAIDHPARGALGVGNDPMAMANRYELLERVVEALRMPGVDGVLGTPDILEDLLLLGALENKIVVGSMNRGGLRGAEFELDDRFTAYTAESIVEAKFDFAKLLLRIDLADRGTADTMEASARAITAAAALRLPIMVEPFISARVGGTVHNDLSTDAVIRSVAISAGLGETSAYTWLKIPVVEDMARVMEATTLPTLLLGGEPDSDEEATYDRWTEAVALPGVRGLVVGRSLLYPPSGDVASAVATAAAIVHGSR
jgi:DhnA family fructose-bisphosphate aldolase class Ia